ncbi:(2,3-dihydroxybenzoyl)adenylate synthase [Paenibacillus sp. N1-5-1-14]|uniref:(2,3-dihydroxybenzoyl)adenylate synthase n=1 Tax=Paenibacillus radicibacter TaxID=2972488 RepID=UPI00215917DA|nr:(2,3-dihydroxybenzoyl)adenylate synthase [Paenibacillus radicibacter]MCR8642845.1 (2,3-dihydroxybenzoyl)adenylate synthase [Paenibacillus radicibacter]
MSVDIPTWPEEWARQYREAGCWQGETFGDMLRRLADEHGDHVAVVSGSIRMGYAELNRRVDQLAAGFHQLGITHGDRVVVQLPNIGTYVEVIFALFRLGAWPVFALPLHRRTEITHITKFADAVAYIIADIEGGFDYRELAAQVQDEVPTLAHVIVVGDPGSRDYHSIHDLYIEPKADLPKPVASEVAFLQLSGGSTGLPKLIPRTHDDYMYSLRISADICGLSKESKYLVVLPAAHNFTMSSPGILGTLYAGGAVVMSRDSSPDAALALIEQERITITAVVPPLALIWLDAAPTRSYDLSSLQVFQVGGAKFNSEAARRVEPVLGCILQQVFGMAEGLVNYTRLDDPEEIKVNTQGRPMSPFDEVLVVNDEDEAIEIGEEGHLLTRGPYTIRGYYRAEAHNAKAFTTDGFYRTGDIVRLTTDGYIVVEGRDKDQINRGGDKIAAAEIENLLLGHPSVHDAALVSMSDSYLGERTCAFIIPHGEAPSVQELKSYIRQQGIAAYKIPDRIEFMDVFPLTKVGKVSKKLLREIIECKIK